MQSDSQQITKKKNRDGSSFGTRFFKLIFAFLDRVMFGEIADFIFGIIKLNTHPLTAVEQAEAKKVFAESINYRGSILMNIR